MHILYNFHNTLCTDRQFLSHTICGCITLSVLLTFAHSVEYSKLFNAIRPVYIQVDRGVLSPTPPEAIGGAAKAEVLVAVLETSASATIASAVVATTAC